MRPRSQHGYREPMQKSQFRLHPGREIAVDCAVTALLALIYALTWRWGTAQGTAPWAATLLAALAVLPVAGRRRWPAAALAVSAIASAILIAITVNPLPALAPAFCMYLIPLRFRHRDALWLLAATLLVIAAGCAAFGGLNHGVSGRGGVDQAEAVMLESSLAIIGAWVAGYSVGQRRAAVASRREQAERLAREQLAEARRASSEERMRIARELHDVVAHSLTLIAVQAGVANHVATRQPEQAAQALSSIEKLSRGALTEMRALLGVLRSDHGDPATQRQGAVLQPAPGLADLEHLAERTAAAGVLVNLDMEGPLPDLPAGLDLAVYRVIQEALTNVVKHAAADRCQVTLASDRGKLTVEVTDDGRGLDGQPGDKTQGHGLIGMRERVGMYGGEFSAAPLPGHGFRVAATFPLTEAKVSA
jgi:signal transduction histidine kinase